MRAAAGDHKAAQLLLPFVVQVLGIEDRGRAKETLSAADQALLDELLGSDGSDHLERDGAGDDDSSAGDGSSDGDKPSKAEP